MGDLLTLAAKMATLRKQLSEAASKQAVKTALTIVGDLAYKTPVDTSQALSNWVVSLGSKNTSEFLPHFPGKFGSTYKASAAETVAFAKQVLASKKPGEVIWITNNLPYIRKLNEGSSAQQPAGFVERAILIGRKMQGKFTLGN